MAPSRLQAARLPTSPPLTMPLEWDPLPPAVRSLTEQLVSASSSGDLSIVLTLYSQLEAQEVEAEAEFLASVFEDALH